MGLIDRTVVQCFFENSIHVLESEQASKSVNFLGLGIVFWLTQSVSEKSTL